MKPPDLPLPAAWPARVRKAVVHVSALAQASLTVSRAWAADSPLVRVRQAGELDQAQQNVALLVEEMRIKDGRWTRISPHKRPFYTPEERLAILALKAARGWTIAQTARVFHVEPATIASWMADLDQTGTHTLVALNEPVNKFPDFVRQVTCQLKALCPTRLLQLSLAGGGRACEFSRDFEGRRDGRAKCSDKK